MTNPQLATKAASLADQLSLNPTLSLTHLTTKAAPVAVAIRAADQSNNSFSEFTWKQKVILAQVLLQTVRGESVEDALDLLDYDAELTEAGDEFCQLNSEDPTESTLGLVLALLLGINQP